MNAGRPHGYARYRLDGCRCYTCAWAVSVYNETRKKAITAGTWQPYVPAEPVRQHVEAIRATGLALTDLTKATGVKAGTLDRLLWGGTRKTRTKSAAALLAYWPTLDDYSNGSLIDPTGTRRRIQGLVAGGFPLKHLAARRGQGRQNFTRLLTAPQVTAGAARDIRALYRQLEVADPEQHGIRQASAIRARQMATKHGWAPTHCWDDDTVDDPTAFPEWTGQCGIPAGAQTHRRLGTPICLPCRDARNAYERERQNRTAA